MDPVMDPVMGQYEKINLLRQKRQNPSSSHQSGVYAALTAIPI